MSNAQDITALIRSIVERQVATTPSGQKLSAIDRAAMDNLVKNIVGNVAQAVVYEIDEHLEAMIELQVAA